MSKISFGARSIGAVAARIVTVLALVTGGVLVAAQPSLAASCSGSACTGKNPSSTGCSTAGASVKKEVSSPNYTYQLRYSSTCKAFWARTIRDDLAEGQCPFIYTKVVQQKYVYSQPDGDYEWLTKTVEYETSHSIQCDGGTQFTYMIADSTSDRYQACFVTAYSTTRPGSGWNCTGWF
ncbi:MAG: hypothetical protein QOE51_1586 [Actinoplanes sp.]|jgi:hypothetical protein|nr:hypothetical protein [Actinoplanes sp.]